MNHETLVVYQPLSSCARGCCVTNICFHYHYVVVVDSDGVGYVVSNANRLDPNAHG